MINEREIKRELKRRRCGWVCHIQPDLIQEDVETFLQAIELGAQQKGINSNHQPILTILDEFEQLFKEPHGLLISLELFDSRPLKLHLLDLVRIVYITFCCSFVLCLIFRS